MYRLAWSLVSIVNMVGVVGKVDLECLNFVEPTVYLGLI